MTKPGQSLLRANLICMVSMLVWAAGLPAADVIIPLLPPLPFAAARMTLAAAALLPLWLWLEGPAVLRRPGWLKGVGVGGMIGVGALLVIMGQTRTGPVTVAVISATMPVVGIALEVALDGRRMTAALWAGLALSFIGGIMALGGGIGGMSLGVGALMIFVSVLTFTLGSRLTVTAFPDLTALGRTTVTLTGAAVATCGAALLHGLFGGPAPDFSTFGMPEWGALVAFAIGSLSISQVLWIMSVDRLGIGLASLHINAAPFYVMLILFAFGAPWNWMQAAGAAVVGLGVLVAQGLIPLQRRVSTP